MITCSNNGSTNWSHGPRRLISLRRKVLGHPASLHAMTPPRKSGSWVYRCTGSTRSSTLPLGVYLAWYRKSTSHSQTRTKLLALESSRQQYYPFADDQRRLCVALHATQNTYNRFCSGGPWQFEWAQTPSHRHIESRSNSRRYTGVAIPKLVFFLNLCIFAFFHPATQNDGQLYATTLSTVRARCKSDSRYARHMAI